MTLIKNPFPFLSENVSPVHLSCLALVRQERETDCVALFVKLVKTNNSGGSQGSGV